MRKINLAFSTFIFTLLLSACSNSASHLPTPLELPGAIIGSTIENARYGSKRKRVAAYVAQHYLQMRQDVKEGGQKALNGAFDVAGISQKKRARAHQIMRVSQKQVFYNGGLVSDNLMRVFTSLYGYEITATDRRINGINEFKAQTLITHYANANFEKLRIAIKNGKGLTLDRLVTQLNIKDSRKRKAFKKKAKALYNKIYLESVVVAIMINT